MGTAYDFRGDSADAVILPAWAQRSVVAITKTLNFTDMANEKSVASFVDTDSFKLFDIPAGTLVLGISATLVTASKAANATLDVGESGGVVDLYGADLNLDGTAGIAISGTTAKYYAAATTIIGTVDNGTILKADGGEVEVRMIAIPA